MPVINLNRDYIYRKQSVHNAMGTSPFFPNPDAEIDAGYWIDAGYCLDAIETMPAGGCKPMYRTGGAAFESYTFRARQS